MTRTSTATSVTQSTPGSGTIATPAATSARRLTRRRQLRTTSSISRMVAGTTVHSAAGGFLVKSLRRAEIATSSLRRRSGERLRPDLVEPLGTHRLRGLQLLREETDAQLLEPPAEVVEALVARAATLGALLQPALLERPDFGHPRPIALGVGSELLDPRGDRLQVARHVLEPLPGRRYDEAFGDQPRELLRDVVGDVLRQPRVLDL